MFVVVAATEDAAVMFDGAAEALLLAVDAVDDVWVVCVLRQRTEIQRKKKLEKAKFKKPKKTKCNDKKKAIFF